MARDLPAVTIKELFTRNYLKYRFRAVDLGEITHEEIKNSACQTASF